MKPAETATSGSWFGGRLLDRLIVVGVDEPEEIRAALLQTVLQRRFTLIVSSCALLMGMLALAMIEPQPVTIGLCALFALLIGYRWWLAIRFEPGDAPAPEWEVRRVIGVSLATFMLAGMGMLASFRTGDMLLALIAAISVMGLVAGLVSRWAAFPRLAVTTILTVGGLAAIGLATAPQPHLRLAVVQLLLVVVGSSAFAVQNHATLIAMLRAQRAARLLAQTDLLTGLPNRAQLMEALAARCGGGAQFALLYLDLDGFKAINDGAGHAAGDVLLREVGKALARSTGGADDIVCRVGGDEFVMVVDGDGEAATAAAFRIAQAVGDVGARIGVSIGIAMAPEDGTHADRLMSRADRALYAAKRAGRGRIRFWRDEARAAA